MSVDAISRSLRTLLAALVVAVVLVPDTAPAAGDETVRDEFTEIAYDGDNGSRDWDADWEEIPLDGGPTSGTIRVVSDPACTADGCLRIGGNGPNLVVPSVVRAADLDGADIATLTYHVRRKRVSNPQGGRVDVRVRDAAGVWTTLTSYGYDTTDAEMTVATHDISDWISDETEIAFRASGWLSGYVYIDNVQIAYGTIAEPPVIDPYPTDRWDQVHVPLEYQITATDPDGDDGELVYAASNLPHGLKIDKHTGLIHGTANDSAYTKSPFEVTITVTDEDGNRTTASFTWTITGDNRAPTLGPMPDAQIDEGTRLSVTAFGDDPDLPADTLTYRLDVAPSGAAINASTGQIVWDTGETDGPGSHTFTVTVEDSGTPSRSASTSFTVTVDEVNLSPVLAAIADQTNGLGDAVDLTVTASDPDLPSNTLRYSATGLPPGLSIGTTSGVISGTTTSAGTSTVTVTVKDNGDPWRSASVAFDWVVVAGNRAPVMVTIAEQAPNASGVVRFTAAATDPDGDDLSYWMIGGPDAIPSGASLNPDTGAFAWTPDASDFGETVSFVIGVTDDGEPALSDQQTVVIVVPQPNRRPELNEIADQLSAEGAALGLTLAATDPDGDGLTWAASGLPDGLQLSQRGVIQGTLGYDAATGSPYEVIITVTDDGTPAKKDQATFSWIVYNTNRPPVIAGQSVTVIGSTPKAIEVTAEDPDGDPLVLSVMQAPAGSLKQTGAVFTYTAPSGYIGTDAFVVQADDGTDTAIATISLMIRSTNQAPTAGDNEYEVVAGVLTVDAPGVLDNDTDSDGDTLLATLVVGPEHGALQLTSGGALSYEADPGFIGTDGFTYRVDDGAGGSDTAFVVIRVLSAPALPAAEAESLTQARDEALTSAVVLSSLAPEPQIGDAEAEPKESMARAVLAIARESFATVPAIRFPVLLLVIALLLGISVGRIGDVPFGARRRRARGMVRSYDRTGGYGLIVPEGGGPDVFVHAGAVRGRDVLAPGDPVEYVVVASKNRPTALRVRRVGAA